MNLALEMDNGYLQTAASSRESAARTSAGLRWALRGLLVGVAAWLVFGAGEPWMLQNAPPSVYDVIAAQAQCPGVHNPAPGCAGVPAWTSPSFE